MSIQGPGLINPILQFENGLGVPYAGGSVYFYSVGTTNVLSVYSDPALTTPLPQPLPLNAAGRSSTSSTGTDTPVYMQPSPYDFVLKDANGVTIYGPITCNGGTWPGAVQSIASIAATVGQSVYANRFTSTIVEAASGTHSILAGSRFDALTIAPSTGAITEAATVYIEGNPSGGSPTNLYALDVAAGNVHVGGDIYKTAWTDYSATSTIVGWTSFTTKKIFYKQIGKLIYVQFALIGTSNSITTTFTLPTAMQTDLLLDVSLGFGKDNGTALTNPGLIEILTASPSTVTIYTSQAAGAWTNSGTKSAVGQFWYQTA